MEKTDLLNLSLPEIDIFLAELGLEGYRASQIKKWVFKEGITCFSQMSNASKSNRSLISEKAFLSRLAIKKILSSSHQSLFTKIDFNGRLDKRFFDNHLTADG